MLGTHEHVVEAIVLPLGIGDDPAPAKVILERRAREVSLLLRRVEPLLLETLDVERHADAHGIGGGARGDATLEACRDARRRDAPLGEEPVGADAGMQVGAA